MTARLERIGVFGGTFDPIHIGHLVLAEVARAALDLDCVLFIPTSSSVFKHDRRLSAPAIRRRMCEVACAGNEAFEVDDREIVRGGESYTIDTLRELTEVHPEAQLFLIVGSDVLEKLDQWRSADAIAQLAVVAAFKRPGEEADEAQLARLRSLGFSIECFEGPQLVIHSSGLRERVAAGKPIRYLVPEAVREIIEGEGLYRDGHSAVSLAPKVESADRPPALSTAERPAAPHPDHDALSEEELLSKAMYRQLKAELKERVDAKRYRHSVGVAKTAKRLAKTYGVDQKKARLAGIVHDWDKCYDDEGMRAHVRELGMQNEVDAWSLANAPGLLHGHTAAKTMAERFEALPPDVIQAIEHHTTAAPTMSDLDKVLYIADALEPGRNFRNLDDLRAMVGVVSLDELFFSTYRLWTELLMERGYRLLHPDTINLWNGFVSEQRKGHAREQ